MQEVTQRRRHGDDLAAGHTTNDPRDLPHASRRGGVTNVVKDAYHVVVFRVGGVWFRHSCGVEA